MGNGGEEGKVGKGESRLDMDEEKCEDGEEISKDGPGPVMVSDTLCPAVHILGT